MKRLILVCLIITAANLLISDDIIVTREVGSWSDHVFNLETQQPVEGAIVYLSPHFPNSPAEYYNCWVDENGYFEFLDIVAAVYDVRVYKNFYYEINTGITINEGINSPVDYNLQRAAGCNMKITFYPDEYYYESSWSLRNMDTGQWYNTAAMGFNSDASVVEYFYLDQGTWRLYYYDTYGDGGLRAYCSNEDGVVQYDYTGEGSEDYIDWFVPAEPGEVCADAITYGTPNTTAVLDDCNGRQEIWYELYFDNTYNNVEISLAGSTFDTMLEFWGNCGDESYIAYNDNWESEEYSKITLPSVVPGYYYAKIYSSEITESGYYQFQVTGTPEAATGGLYGFVYDETSGVPIEGAQVDIHIVGREGNSRPIEYTDQDGYFEFYDLSVTSYEIIVTKVLYDDYYDEISIQEGSNNIEIELTPFTNWSTYLTLTVDSWENEASYNLWDANNSTWWWEDNRTFPTEYSTQDWWLNLPEGYYEVHCWDTYSDGGISGTVEDFWGNTLTSWGAYDYGAEGIFGFTIGNGVFYGDVDQNGVVEAYDAANVLQYVVELDPDGVPLPWSEITQQRANVDGNSYIGAYDASLILMYVSEIIDQFPAEYMATPVAVPVNKDPNGNYQLLK